MIEKEELIQWPSELVPFRVAVSDERKEIFVGAYEMILVREGYFDRLPIIWHVKERGKERQMRRIEER